ncbi:MAG: UDP-N-acetylglucosamine--N-acetylmuramyl-(pentapeptide) pyrophosphoryl-undecaprenol N-acetylglucosamine transferase [bacterium]|nr:UDP-N-acetylglucosamine--N-acetylmuramyl-(pentapeptide) pyrophosphoryl-undecaprenol N-acetylglucosamine transferase [bacterium]
MKIIITGGHLTPAMSVIDEINKKNSNGNISIVFVGREFALDSEKTHSLEYKEITKLNIHFIPLQTGRLNRSISIHSIMNVLKIPLGFMNAWKIIHEQKPDVVLSFGSYIALPVVFWAWIYKIPIYTHEQTISPGFANKIIGKLATKIFIAFEKTRLYFDSRKTILTGNPIRSSVFSIKDIPFEIKKTKPVLYITGGSLGSHSINEHVSKLLKKLLKSYVVIHQTGSTKEYNDYEDLLKQKEKLSEELRKNYFIKEHFYENEIGYIYSKTDLVIGRAGANTFFELIALKIPAIFIPLPWSANREQEKHAKFFENNKVGRVFNQSDSSENLMREINKMIINIDEYKNNFTSLSHLYNHNAAEFIVSQIFTKV